MMRLVGSGPGDITPDGCAVEFYALLPTTGEPETVHEAVSPGASIVELGCGTGRILRRLAELGHPVHGVDESPAMLAYLHDLPTTRSTIEDLDLRRVFDVVLLASTMINADPDLRSAFLTTCRRHVAPDGVVVIQQSSPSGFDTVKESEEAVVGDIRRVIRSARRVGSRLDVVVDYHVGDRTWTHEFPRYRIGDAELTADLARAGLRFDRWLTDDHCWFTARPLEMRPTE
jgi:SAM-dependent methyltransferase